MKIPTNSSASFNKYLQTSINDGNKNSSIRVIPKVPIAIENGIVARIEFWYKTLCSILFLTEKTRTDGVIKFLEYSMNHSTLILKTFFILKTPFLSRIHSAAIIAPSANPSRLCAVCFISIVSTADV